MLWACTKIGLFLEHLLVWSTYHWLKMAEIPPTINWVDTKGAKRMTYEMLSASAAVCNRTYVHDHRSDLVSESQEDSILEYSDLRDSEISDGRK